MGRKRNEAHIPAEKFATPFNTIKKEEIYLWVSPLDRRKAIMAISPAYSPWAPEFGWKLMWSYLGGGTCHVGIERLYQFLLLGHRLLVRVITSV